VDTDLSLSGVAYPILRRGAIPPIGLGVGDSVNGNARLRLSGGGLPVCRDLLLNVLPGSVTIIGSDPTQSGSDIPRSNLRLRVDGVGGAFSGRFLHPGTGKPVFFDGAFRLPLGDGTPGAANDVQAAQGRGIFRGPDAAGAVLLVP
jgi:hypothetical protein